MSRTKEYLLRKTEKATTENFELVRTITYENTIPLYMYRSKKTRITVYIAEVDGPIISGDFNIVTETFDNDGLPYAVKHLIFNGSDKYPYNGILKLWAERSLGMNITTTILQNRTCFAINAAGSEGFLTLMPIYLDHILYPTLEDSAYLTKVHHINGKGYDDGVVYRKTEKDERSSHYFIKNKMFQALYPGNNGYKSIIIGTTKNLRESTNNEKVKQFHKKFYRPENLTILITGKIPHHKIFQALLPLEQKIMSKKRTNIFEIPWQTPIRPITKSADVKVIFPSTNETYGEVHVAWRGLRATTKIYDYLGCVSFLEYLTKTKSSPLTKAFGEIGDSFFITWSVNELSVPHSNIIFNNVPVKHIDLITNKSIHTVLSNVCIDGINMETMKTVIHNLILNYRIGLENNPHKNIAIFLFDHIVYDKMDYLDQRLNVISEFKKLTNESQTYFLYLVKKYFVDAPMIVVKGIPSLAEHVDLLKEEKQRIAAQIGTLGKSGLDQKTKKLKEAIRKIKKPVPKDILEKMTISFPNSITYHPIGKYTTETSEQHRNLDVRKLPLFTYLDCVDTNVYYLQVVMDTSSISTEYRPYIPLLVDVITKSPMKKGDQLIPYEEVKNSLLVDTIKVQSYIGIDTLEDISFSISLILQTELHNYEKSVQWCKKLLYDTKLTAESLKLVISQTLNDIDKIKVQGEMLVATLMEILLYTDDSHKFTYNRLRQHKFLSDVQERLNTDVGQKEVMAKMEFVRQTLTSPKNMFAYMAVDVKKLTEQISDVLSPWNKFFSDFMSSEETKINIPSKWKHLMHPISNIYNGSIVGFECINKNCSFFYQTCPCINDYEHFELPALKVCLTYLGQKGGPVWREIRDRQALSNDFSLFTSTADGLLGLKFNSSKDVVAAYRTTKLIVEMHLDRTKWNQHLFEKAKSSTMLNYINEVKSINDMIKTSLTCYCKNLPHDYNYKMVRRVSAVTIDDMSRVAFKYIKPLFDSKQCKTAIVCNITEVVKLEKTFQEMEYNFNVYKRLEEELNDYIENMKT